MDRKAFFQLAFNNVRTVPEPVNIAIVPNKPLPQGSLVWISPAIYDLEYLHSRGGRRFEVKGSPLLHLDDAFPALNRLEIHAVEGTTPTTATYSSAILPKSLLKDCLENGGKVSRERAVTAISYNRGKALLQESVSERVREMLFGKTQLPDAKRASLGFSLSPDWSRVLDLKNGSDESTLYVTGPQNFSIIQQVDTDSMEAKRLYPHSPCSPFLSKDAQTGQVFSMEMEWIKPSMARYTIKCDAQVFCRFAARPNYLSKLGVTEDYLVAMFCPLRMTRRPEERNHIILGSVECFKFEPDESTLFFVFNRHSQQLHAVYQHSACFSPQGVVNCYHNNNSLVLDAIVYEDASGWQNYQRLDYLRERAASERMPMGVLKRFVLNDLAMEAARFDGAAGLLSSFPWAVAHSLAVNISNVCFNADLLAGLPVQYYYAQSIRREDRGKLGVWWNSIVKIDVATGYVKTVYTRDGSYPGPPIFVMNSEQDRLNEPIMDVARTMPPTPESMRTVHMTTSPSHADTLALDASKLSHPQRYEQELNGAIVTVLLDTLSLTSIVAFISPEDGQELGRIQLPEIVSPMKGNMQVHWIPSAQTKRRMVRASILPSGTSTIMEVSTPIKQQQLYYATPKREPESPTKK